jgi:hypothetical protein
MASAHSLFIAWRPGRIGVDVVVLQLPVCAIESTAVKSGPTCSWFVRVSSS